MKEQNKICLPDREAQKLESKAKIEILIKENGFNNDKRRYRWAWKESAEKNVFGIASTINEIKIRSQRMFPNHEIELLFL